MILKDISRSQVISPSVVHTNVWLPLKTVSIYTALKSSLWKYFGLLLLLCGCMDRGYYVMMVSIFTSQSISLHKATTVSNAALRQQPIRCQWPQLAHNSALWACFLELKRYQEFVLYHISCSVAWCLITIYRPSCGTCARNSMILKHCGLVTPWGGIGLCQNWNR